MKNQLTILIIGCITIFSVQAQKSGESYLGKTDFQVLLKAIPEMPATTEAAFEYAYNGNLNANSGLIMQERFADYNRKMDLFSNAFGSAFASKAQEYYDKKGNRGLYNDSKRQVNQNELIKNMGGVDHIQNMSESQRSAAAKNAAAKQMSGSAFSPFSEEEMKRMMNDPEYASRMAAKYNNLTEKQKAEMVQSRLDAMGNEPKTPEQVESEHQEFESLLRKRQVAKNTMDINQFVADFSGNISNAATEYENAMQRIRESNGNHKDLNEDFEAAYKKIPLVIMGEGKDPDPYKVKELRKKYALLHKKRAALELSEAQIGYKKLMNSINQAIADYHSFLDKNNYRVNGKMSDVVRGTNTELSLVQAEQTIGSAISKLGDICYDETATAAGYEHDYRSILTER